MSIDLTQKISVILAGLDSRMAAAEAGAKPPIVIALEGSSSAAYYATQGTIPTPDSRVKVSDNGTTYATMAAGRFCGEAGRLIANATGREVWFIKGGIPGSTLYQWSTSSSTQRKALLDKVNAATAAGIAVTAMLSQIGDNDADGGDGVGGPNSYSERLTKIRQLHSLNRSETNLSNLMIFVGGSHNKVNAKPLRIGYQREAEMTAVNNDANVRFGFSTYDLATSDGQHQTDASQLISAPRFAAQVIAWLNGTQQSRAPYPSGIQRISDTVVRMLVSYPAGESDYTPASNLYGGFLVPTNGGAGSEIQGVGTRVSASAIDWTFPSTPAACTFIFSPNDETQVFAKGNDALALPIEPDASAFAVPAYSASTPAPAFTAQPSISPTSGTVGDTFTGSDGTITNSMSVARQWLLNGTAISGATNSTYVSTAAGNLTYRVTATGAGGTTPATSTAVTVNAAAVTPTLNALTVSNGSGTVGSAYSGTISGTTSGSSLALTGAGAPGLSISGTTISGTPTTAGAVNIVETLSGATNSPRTTSNVITVAASSTGPTYTATGKSAKQHYASGASNPPSEQPVGFNSFIQSSATTAKTLNDPSGVATGWSTVTSTRAGDLASNASGKSTGNNSGIYPDLALIGNWYSVGPQVESYTGLDPTKYYKVYVCGSRGGVTNQKITAKVTGRDSTNAAITTAEQTLDVSDNTANRLDMGYVKPDASGNLLISWRQGGDTNAKLCVIELVEFTGP